VHPFYPLDAPELNYTLPEFGITMPFKPTEFTQVNPVINRLLVRRAIGLLDPQPGERIADLFCGLGNFTLPIAHRGAHVVGVEGSAALVARAIANAAYNGLAERTEYRQADLFQATAHSLVELGHFDKMLIDPPRDGAVEVIKALAGQGPRRIVYVSCNPATLARDAALLVHTQGYRLKAAGVANMFPHTAHVESIALFEKQGFAA
jgi:23S rRNA (uracil1939-C5)-methyltransferase